MLQTRSNSYISQTDNSVQGIHWGPLLRTPHPSPDRLASSGGGPMSGYQALFHSTPCSTFGDATGELGRIETFGNHFKMVNVTKGVLIEW